MCSMRFEATDSDQTESTEMEREEVFQKILSKNNTVLADISPCKCMENKLSLTHKPEHTHQRFNIAARLNLNWAQERESTW